MTPRRLRIEMLLMSGTLAAALATTPVLAAWVHPVTTGGSGAATGPGTSTAPGPSAPVSTTVTNPNFNAKALVTGVSAGTVTTVTNQIVKADGSTVTTVQTITSYAAPTTIAVTVSFVPPGQAPFSHTFDFASLNSVAQQVNATYNNGLFTTSYTVKATPNPAGDALTVTYGLTGSPIANNITVALPPPATTTTTNTTTTGATAPVVNNPGAQQSVSSLLTDAGATASSDVVQEVEALSAEAQRAIVACNSNTPHCVADVLDDYADKLEALAPRLPPSLRTLPAIVRRAAAKVRAAKTRSAEASAVKEAVVAVNKTIALLRAEDPDAAKTGQPIGRAVDQTLEVAEVKLLRSTGL